MDAQNRLDHQDRFDCLIRCDATREIATGHVMRCLALADAVLAGGGRTAFVMAGCPETLVARVEEKHEVIFLPGTIEVGTAGDATAFAGIAVEWAAKNSTDALCLFLDGYHLLEDYRQILRRASDRPLAIIDDLHQCEAYSADLIINQNPGVTAADYRGIEEKTRLLLGLDYAILREEFRRYKAARPQKNLPEIAENIVVTMGGTDINNATALILSGLDLMLSENSCGFPQGQTFDITAIVGGGNSNAESLARLCADLNAKSQGRASWQCQSAVKDMPAALGRADLLISAGGTTIWEAAYLGLPTAALIIADNQKPGMRAFADSGAVDYLGLSEDNNPQSIAEKLLPLIGQDGARKRRQMVAAAAVVDGLGAERVAGAMARVASNKDRNK